MILIIQTSEQYHCHHPKNDDYDDKYVLNQSDDGDDDDDNDDDNDDDEDDDDDKDHEWSLQSQSLGVSGSSCEEHHLPQLSVLSFNNSSP